MKRTFPIIVVILMILGGIYANFTEDNDGLSLKDCNFGFDPNSDSDILWHDETKIEWKDMEDIVAEPTMDELLDGICQVESEGGLRIIGDPVDLTDLGKWQDRINRSIRNNAMAHLLEGSRRQFSNLQSNDLNENLVDICIRDGKVVYAKEYKAIGAYQLHKIYVDDVNKILGEDRYTYADRWDADKSREMVRIYTEHYGQWAIFDFEVLARIHNGGPDGWKKESTLPYWEKVKAELYK